MSILLHVPILSVTSNVNRRRMFEKVSTCLQSSPFINIGLWVELVSMKKLWRSRTNGQIKPGRKANK